MLNVECKIDINKKEMFPCPLIYFLFDFYLIFIQKDYFSDDDTFRPFSLHCYKIFHISELNFLMLSKTMKL